MNKKILLAGAGHGHLSFLHNIGRLKTVGFEITVVSPDRYHYYSGMGPGLLAGTYTPDDCRFDVQRITESNNGIFIKDKIISFNPEKKTAETASGLTLNYDSVSFNIGSEMKTLLPDRESIFNVKPISNLFKAGEFIREKFKNRNFKCAVIGGGYAGIECACNVKYLSRLIGVNGDVTIFERTGFMEHEKPSFRNSVIKELNRIGVKISDNTGNVIFKNAKLATEKNNEFEGDIYLNAAGISAPEIFKLSGIKTGNDGGLAVNRFLQSESYPEVFGTGDCIHFSDMPLRKAGVYAVRQNSIILHNVVSFLKGKPLKPFHPQNNYLKILSAGFNRGILYRRPFILRGKTAFIIKDYIDRRFMRHFS